MKNATRVFASTFGAIFALAGIEHGIGEIFQGNVAPSGIMILSWPELAFFRSLGGEPAHDDHSEFSHNRNPCHLHFYDLARVGNSLCSEEEWWIDYDFIVHRHAPGGRRHFPPIIGIISGAVGTKINAPLTWWRAHLPMSFPAFRWKIMGLVLYCLHHCLAHHASRISLYWIFLPCERSNPYPGYFVLCSWDPPTYGLYWVCI